MIAVSENLYVAYMDLINVERKGYTDLIVAFLSDYAFLLAWPPVYRKIRYLC